MRRKWTCAGLHGAAALAAGVALLNSSLPALPAAPAPLAPADGLIWLHDSQAGRLLAFRPDGKADRTLDLPKGVPFLGLTPDGRKLLYAAKAGGRMTYHARALGAAAPGTDLGLDHSPFDGPLIWARDGKRLIRERGEDPKRIVGVRSMIIQYAIYDLTGKKLAPLDLPWDRRVLGWAPDEKGVVTVSFGERNPGALSIHRLGEKPAELKPVDPPFWPNRVVGAADGRTMLAPGCASVPGARGWHHALWTVDATTGRAVQLIHEPGQGYSDACWSPNGKRLCMLWCYEKAPGSGAGWDQCRLTVANADGAGRVTVTLRDKAKGQKPDSLHLLGWFPAVK
jgi:hypothetical protein